MSTLTHFPSSILGRKDGGFVIAFALNDGRKTFLGVCDGRVWMYLKTDFNDHVKPLFYAADALEIVKAILNTEFNEYSNSALIDCSLDD